MPHGHHMDEDMLGKAYDARLIRRLLHFVKPHAWLMTAAFVLLLGSTGVELLMPWVFKIGIDRYMAPLWQRYECASGARAALDAMPQADRMVRWTDDVHVLVRKTAFKNMPTNVKRALETQAVQDTNTFYVFAAADRSVDVGTVASNYWIVPQGKLAGIPSGVLLKARAGDVHGIALLAIAVAIIVVLRLGVNYGHVLTLQIAGQRTMYDVRVAVHRHIEKLSLRYFDRNPVGRLVTRVTNDIDAINEVFSTVLMELAKNTLFFIGAVVILFVLNARLALVALSLVPVFVVVAAVFRKRARDVYREVRRHLSVLNSTLNEDISGCKIIQVFRQERRRRDEFKVKNNRFFSANMRELLVFGIFRPLVDMLRSSGIAMILVYGGVCVLTGSLTLGALVAFVQYLGEMYGPIIAMSQQYSVMQSAMAASERIFKILDETPEIRDADTPATIGTTQGRVEFSHVSFAYIEGTPVLRNVSFSVEPGRSVAIVGPTGAGKTSIINLLCRFYDPAAGSVTIDGVDVRQWPVAMLRRQMAIVLQDAFVFSRTVDENIRLGDAGISRERMAAAAEMVQALPFIDALPKGFDEMMMERGATISAGQRQLLCFARALAHDPKVLILDEATSNVDPATEVLIQQAIGTLMKGRTSIVIAHRLSTIKKADEIIVIDDGRIIERGTHDQLFARRGVYYNLYLLQFGQNTTA